VAAGQLREAANAGTSGAALDSRLLRHGTDRFGSTVQGFEQRQ
jgi:hypothetical protein